MDISKFEQWMEAITFAEAGEHETARRIMNSHRKAVLLALSDRSIQGKLLKYALNICKRIDAEMDILYQTVEGNISSTMEGFIKEAESEGVKCRLIKNSGCMKSAVFEYSRRKRGVQFVVVGEEPQLDIGCNAKGFEETWKKLKCPLVVVSTGELPQTA